MTFSGNYHLEDKFKLTLGGALNQYYGKHFGKIIWAQDASNSINDYKWYDGTGLKNDFNIYIKANIRLFRKFFLFGDLQYRDILYKMTGTLEDLRPADQIHSFSFFNPKAGVIY